MRLFLGLLTASLAAAQSNGLAISQIYNINFFSAHPYNSSYVVIFNSGPQAAPLDGLSLQTINSNAVWQALPLTGSLQPGQSFLVELQSSLGYDPNIAADATWSVPLNILAVFAIAQGVAPLADYWPPASAVIDLVGFDGTKYPFRGQPSPALDGTVALFRKSAGCLNTGDNLLDFATASPAPVNSRSPLKPCALALPAPTISSVVNAATLRPSSAVHGALMILNGTGFVNGHTSVTFGGIPANTYSITPSQIVFGVPFGLTLTSPAPLRVQVDQAGSATQQLAIVRSAPGIFSVQTQMSPGQAPQNQDGTPNRASAPSQPGSVISFWATGLSAPVVFESLGPHPVPGKTANLRGQTADLNVTVGGVPATIVAVQEMSGAMPGIFRVDARIPAAIPGGIQPIVLSQWQNSSPPLYIYLSPRAAVNTNYSLASVGAVDLAYDPFRQVLWASTASSAPVDFTNTPPSQPNSVLMIDPVSHNVISAIPCGGWAYRIALSSSGSYLWLAMNDGTIKRLNLATGQVDFALQLSALVQQALPSLNTSAGFQIAVLAPSPIDEETVVITFPNFEGEGYPLIALKGNTLLPSIGPPDSYAVFNSDGTLWTEKHLLSITPQGMQVLASVPINSGLIALVVINAGGPLVAAGSTLAAGNTLRRSSDLGQMGLLASGLVINKNKQGTPNAVYDSSDGLIYFGGALGGPSNYTIQAFDAAGMVPVGQFSFPYSMPPLPNQTPSARLVTIGAEGFATVFSEPTSNGSGGAIFFIPRSLVQTLPNLSAPPAQPANGQVRKFAFPASSAAVDPLSPTVYLSVSSLVPGFGNSIVPFDTKAGTFGQPTWVGSEPGAGVVSRDERYLYVDISGAYSVLRFDLTTMESDLEFLVCDDYYVFASAILIGGLPTPVSALLNVPNAPSTTIAVQRSIIGYTTSGIAIYDNGVKRGETTGPAVSSATAPTPPTDSAQFSPQGDFLFAINDQDSGDQFSRWRVTLNGFEFDAAQSGLYGDSNTTTLLCFSSQTVLCASSDGTLFDPFGLTKLRHFGATAQVVGIESSGPVSADPANDRVYFMDSFQSVLYSFSVSTGQAIGTMRLPVGVGESAFQMQLLSSGELLILTNFSIDIVPTSLIHN